MNNTPLIKVLIFSLGTWFCWLTSTVCYDIAFNQSFSFTGMFVFLMCFAYSVVCITYAGVLVYIAIPEDRVIILAKILCKKS